jgi:hypothetical protein
MICPRDEPRSFGPVPTVPEQDLAAAIRSQRLLERFLELLERVHMLHCGGERAISYEVA